MLLVYSRYFSQRPPIENRLSGRLMVKLPQTRYAGSYPELLTENGATACHMPLAALPARGTIAGHARRTSTSPTQGAGGARPPPSGGTCRLRWKYGDGSPHRRRYQTPRDKCSRGPDCFFIVRDLTDFYCCMVWLKSYRLPNRSATQIIQPMKHNK
jgi:hypothetical protein